MSQVILNAFGHVSMEVEMRVNITLQVNGAELALSLHGDIKTDSLAITRPVV